MSRGYWEVRDAQDIRPGQRIRVEARDIDGTFMGVDAEGTVYYLDEFGVPGRVTADEEFEVLCR